MMRTALYIAAALILAWPSSAVPILGIGQTSSSTAVSTLSTSDTDAFVTPARFSQIAYCSSAAVMTWKCGPPCDALPNVAPIVTGGDDGLIPMYFIAHDPDAQSIVVSHQGTDPRNALSILNDAKFVLTKLDPTFFPGMDSSIEVHDGFQQTFGRTADGILGNVTAALNSTGAKTVEIHGHSLGAAVASLDAVFLRQKLPADVKVTSTVFGLPRVGNQAWANLVDSMVPGLGHIHNKNDPVGIVPPRTLDFQHPSGEVHIQANNDSVACTGQENTDQLCISNLSLLDASVGDHEGPYYQGIIMGHSGCPL